jgi:hypothetical protein
MPTDSAGHDLTRRDNADAPRCPMERLADRFMDAPKPAGFRVCAFRNPSGECEFSVRGRISSPDSIDGLINFLARVRG